jgi:hypothetical protein
MCWCCQWSTSPPPWRRPPARQRRCRGALGQLDGRFRAGEHLSDRLAGMWPLLSVVYSAICLSLVPTPAINLPTCLPRSLPAISPAAQVPVSAAQLLRCLWKGAGWLRALHGAAQEWRQPLPLQRHCGARSGPREIGRGRREGGGRGQGAGLGCRACWLPACPGAMAALPASHLGGSADAFLSCSQGCRGCAGGIRAWRGEARL